MRRRASVTALLVALAGHGVGAHAQIGPPGGGDRGARLRPFADPGAVIGAEIAFNQLAQTRGQWTAFRQTAAAQAVMFVPARVDAPTWLKKRADPAVSVKWQPYAVWSSCDGAYAVTRGAWQRAEPGGAGSVGWFVTVWQRQTDGGYKWVLDVGDALAAPLETPEMIAGKVADCAAAAPRGDGAGPGAPPPPGDPRKRRPGKLKLVPLADPAAAQSPDASLRWNAAIDARGAGSLSVELRKDGAWQEVVRERVAAGG